MISNTLIPYSFIVISAGRSLVEEFAIRRDLRAIFDFDS
jgi:hypothetical protein